MPTHKRTNAANERQALAAHLAAVLAHPDTPVDLYNAIVDELSDISSYIPWESASHIALALEAYNKREEKEAH